MRTRTTRAWAASLVLVSMAGVTSCAGDDEVALVAADPIVQQVAAPSGLTVDVTGSDATVTWSAPGADVTVTAYEVYLDTTAPVSVDATTTEQVFRDLVPGRHLVQVVALTSDGTVTTAAVASFEVDFPVYNSAPARTAAPPAAAPPAATSPVTATTAPVPTVTVTAPAQVTPAPAAAAPATTSSGAPAASASTTRPMTVKLSLRQGSGYDVTDRESGDDACEGGRDGFSDIKIGAAITVKGATGALIATGSITSASFNETGRSQVPVPPTDDPDDDWGNPADWPVHEIAGGYCDYFGLLDVPRDTFYTVEVTGRGERAFSDADLTSAGDTAHLTLGDFSS